MILNTITSSSSSSSSSSEVVKMVITKNGVNRQCWELLKEEDDGSQWARVSGYGQNREYRVPSGFAPSGNVYDTRYSISVYGSNDRVLFNSGGTFTFWYIIHPIYYRVK